MNDMGTTLIVWAAILGAIAAGSMVLGAIVGITTPMSNNTVGAMAGFGAGALISALAIELVAPTVQALSNAEAAHGPAELLVLHKSQYEVFARNHPEFQFQDPRLI